MFFGLFVEDKKLDSDLHMWQLIRGKNLDFCSAFEIRLLVYQDKWCFSIRLEQQSGLIFFFQNARRQSSSKEYHVIQ